VKGKSNIMMNLKIIKSEIKNKMTKTLEILYTHDCLLENKYKEKVHILNKGSTMLNLWKHRAIFSVFLKV